MTDFKEQIFNLESEVDIIINAKSIIAKDDEGEDKIDAKNVEGISYEQFVENRISPVALFTIPLIVGFFLCFLPKISWLIPLGFFVLGGLSFVFFFFDTMLESSIARRLIASVWSNKGYTITILNVGGNNLVFSTYLSDLYKIKQIRNKVDELKEHLAKQVKATPSVAPSTSTANESNLDKLKKIGELYKSGLLSEEEFNQKKSELL